MAVKPIPDGYHSVQPYLMFNGAAKAMEFYKKAFGATERLCMKQPDGRIGHAELQRRPVQHRGLRGQRHLLNSVGRNEARVVVRLEISLGPAREGAHLPMAEHGVLAARPAWGSRHRIAVKPGPRHR